MITNNSHVCNSFWHFANTGQWAGCKIPPRNPKGLIFRDPVNGGSGKTVKVAVGHHYCT